MNTSQLTRQISGAPAMSHTGVNISAFNPTNGAKFSPNLYAHLTSRKHSLQGKLARGFTDAEDVKWIGFFDDTGMFVGARLSLVLCYGSKAQVSCPVNLGPLAEVVDFWKNYAQDGRCAIDTSHTSYFVNDQSRWQMNGHSRDCLWCGKVSQNLKQWTTKVKHEQWVSASAPIAATAL